MRFIARLAMRGPIYAAATAAALQLASLAFGLLVILSGGVIALVTLRHGAAQGLRLVGSATLLATVVQ